MLRSSTILYCATVCTRGFLYAIQSDWLMYSACCSSVTPKIRSGLVCQPCSVYSIGSLAGIRLSLAALSSSRVRREATLIVISPALTREVGGREPPRVYGWCA